MIVSELKLFEFFIHELNLPENKAKQYVAVLNEAQEKLEEKIDKKIDDKKIHFVSEIKEDMAKLEGKIAETKSEIIKWMFVFVMGLLVSLSGIMIAILHAYLK